MATSSDLIGLAESHLGDDGATFWDWYFGGGYVNGGQTPWCACFVSWCLDQLGVGCEGIPSAYVPGIQAAAAGAGKALSPSDAQAGDVIVFDWNSNGSGDHVGFCVENHGGWMDTVEGNVSNSVGKRSRYWKNVLMAIRPDYDGQASAPATTDASDGIGDLDGEAGDLLIDGYFGPLTIKYVQMALQHHGYYVGDLVDGDFGPLTKTELQRYLRYSVGTYQRNCDGDFAYYSVVALQQYLKNLGYYFDTDTADGSREWCSVDGDWGAYTTKALQRALNSGRF